MTLGILTSNQEYIIIFLWLFKLGIPIMDRGRLLKYNIGLLKCDYYHSMLPLVLNIPVINCHTHIAR